MPVNYTASISAAVKRFWATRTAQAARQGSGGKKDQGARAAVTGGAQMDGFIALCRQMLLDFGLSDEDIFVKKKLQLPGYFRATKEWDLLAVHERKLIAVIEVKSHIGSFGNNFNNRTEEALGSATDIWTAFREGAFAKSPRPWLGYLFLLEDSPKSRSPVSTKEPHYSVFPEFRGSSYAKRYEILLRKLVRERHYDSAAFILSAKDTGIKGMYTEPAGDLTVDGFVRSLQSHVGAYL